MTVKNIHAENNIGLVYACAKRFIGRGIEYDDIIQAGCLGLTKAAKAFDETKGTQFSTYAVPVILGEIKQLFRENGAVKVSRALKDLALKINLETEKFLSKYDREPTINELSSILSETPEAIFEALESAQRPISLNISKNGENNEFDIPVDFEEDKISVKLSLLKALESLDKIDRYLIVLRFFKGKTQCETAKILGFTQVKVSRKEKIILKELRMKLT